VADTLKIEKVFEDYALWSRVAEKHELANLSDVLLKYREVGSGMSGTAFDYGRKVAAQSLQNLLGLNSGVGLVMLKDLLEGKLEVRMQICDQGGD